MRYHRSIRLIVAALCFGFVVATGWAAPNPAPGYFIGFSQDTLANDWRLAQADALSRELERHPEIRFTLTDGQGSTARQILDIEDLVAAGVNLLITSPRDQRATAPAVAAAYRKGIPVLLLTRHVLSDDYTALIAPDDAAIARRAARFIAERLKGQGRVLVLQGVPTASTAIVRTEAFQNELRRYPGIEIVAIRPANYLRADAIQAVERVLAEGIGFDAIYSQSDSMAAGARMALKFAGIDPASLIIVGIDYIQEAREAIRRGEQTASFTYPLCAKEGAEAAWKILHGERVPRRIVVESTMVTRQNVEQVEPIF